MHTRSALSSLIAGSLAAGGLIIGAVASAADAPPGVRWRQTQSMEMMGMSMPARTTEFCQEAGSDSLPIKPDKNCTMHDVKRTPKGATFRMSCTGENAFEADGDMVFLGPDHTRSTMRVRMAEGEMTMKSESQKLGPCTGSEVNLQTKKMIAKAQADAAAAQAEAARKQAQMCAATGAAAVQGPGDEEDLLLRLPDARGVPQAGRVRGTDEQLRCGRRAGRAAQHLGQTVRRRRRATA
jgi:hypothetical protein